MLARRPPDLWVERVEGNMESPAVCIPSADTDAFGAELQRAPLYCWHV